MENQPKEAFNEIVDHLQDYVETQKEIIKLQTVKHGSFAAGNIAAVMLLALFLMVTYFFLNVALALLIANASSLFIAFLWVGLGNLIIAILVYLLRNTLVVRPIQNIIIKLTTE
jgi:hypothetical protein